MNLINATEQKQTFMNLFNLYVFELSFKEEMLQNTINDKGISVPPKGFDDFFENKESLLIYDDDKLCGFLTWINDTNSYCLDEIFILPYKRNQGIATKVIDEYRNKHRGIFTTHILKKNQDAIYFFEKYFNKNGISYIKSERDAIAYDYKSVLDN